MRRNPSIAFATCLVLSAVASAIASELAPGLLRPDEVPWPASTPTDGTAMRPGLQTLVISGDAKAASLYTMLFKLPAKTTIPPHAHPDARSCFVLSGTWYFAYGDVRDQSRLKALPPGSHYTEPAGMNHFAETRNEPVVAQCTAVGPTGTTFVDADDDPRLPERGWD